MLIDDFLPEYQISKVHQLTIKAPADVVYKTLLTVNLGRSSLIKVLFKIRGLPYSMLTLTGMQMMGFTKLGEVPGQELLFGLAGRFWTVKGNLQPVTPASFKGFQKTGFAKAAWNFSLLEDGENHTLIKTETRIQCFDKRSFSRFRLYWFLVGPFSSLIRKRMLKIVKDESIYSQNIF